MVDNFNEYHAIEVVSVGKVNCDIIWWPIWPSVYALNRDSKVSHIIIIIVCRRRPTARENQNNNISKWLLLEPRALNDTQCGALMTA